MFNVCAGRESTAHRKLSESPVVSWQPSLPFVWALAIPNLQEGACFQYASGGGWDRAPAGKGETVNVPLGWPLRFLQRAQRGIRDSSPNLPDFEADGTAVEWDAVTPRPFISYAREDLAIASQLYDDLRALGAEPWMDKKNLLGGQNWRVAIRRAVRESSHFVAILSSNSVSKRGFVQKELREAISVLEEFPPNEIFVIPVRLENVEPTHEALKDLHWIDLFPSYDAGLHALGKSLTKAPAVTPTRTVSPSIEHTGRPKKPRTRVIGGIVIVLAAVLAFVANIKSRFEQRWMDQYNCGAGEHWVGMTPHTMERPFQITAEQAKHAVFHGEFRWSTVINQVKQTTIGEVELEVDGRRSVIYKWNSPATSTHSFDIRISNLLVGTSGRFTIRWKWENGTSGICVARSGMTFPPA